MTRRYVHTHTHTPCEKRILVWLWPTLSACNPPTFFPFDQIITCFLNAHQTGSAAALSSSLYLSIFLPPSRLLDLPAAANTALTNSAILLMLQFLSQAASGAGAAAMEELWEQTKDVVSGKPDAPKIFPTQVPACKPYAAHML